MLRNEADSKRDGTCFQENPCEPESLGSKTASRTRTAAAIRAIAAKVMRQPRYIPTVLPKGRPTIMATELPDTIMPKAFESCPGGAILTASGVTMDQKIACEQATTTREAISIQ